MSWNTTLKHGGTVGPSQLVKLSLKVFFQCRNIWEFNNIPYIASTIMSYTIECCFIFALFPNIGEKNILKSNEAAHAIWVVICMKKKKLDKKSGLN